MGIKICKNLCTEQGNIVGRKYINSYKFLYPYGITLGDSTIAPASEVAEGHTLAFF
jgi:hypothetical protein